MKGNSWSWTLLVSGGHFWVDFYANMLPPLLPIISLMWGLNNSQLAVIISVQSMAANLLQPVLGYFIDRNPQKWSMGLAIAVTAIPMSLIYLADNYYLFIIAVSIAGLGMALFHPLGAIRAVRESDDDSKALKMSVFSSLGSLGYSISPVITAFLADTWGLKSLVLTLIPGIIWVLFMRDFQGQNTVGITNTMVNEKREEKTDPKIYKTLIFVSCIVALRSWLIIATVVFIPILMVSQGISRARVGLYLTIYLLAGTLGGIICGYIYPRVGQKKVLVGSFLLSLLLLPIYLYTNEILILVLLGLNLMGTFPVTVVIGQELFPKRAGLASGLTMGFAYGLGGVGTALTGLGADHWGIVISLLITSLVMIPAIIMTMAIKKPQYIVNITKNTSEGV